MDERNDRFEVELELLAVSPTPYQQSDAIKSVLSRKKRVKHWMVYVSVVAGEMRWIQNRMIYSRF